MPTVTGANVTEWKMREMARRAGKKYEPEGKKNMYASTKKGYYAFLLSEPEHTIGPVVFRSTEHWEYKVIHYD